MRSIRKWLTQALLLALVLMTCPARAHDDDLSLKRLRDRPASARDAVTHLLHRAGIARAEGRLPEAEALLDRAWRRAPESPAVARCRAQLALDLDRPADALAALAVADSDARVPWLRADALARLGRTREAASLMDSMLARTPESRPEQVLARVALALARPEEGAAAALVHLDAGLRRRPGAWELIARALDLELAAGRHDAALARVDRLLVFSPERPTLLERRGDILAAAGRTYEAREAWSRALEAIEDRGLRREAEREFAQALRARLAEPEGSGSTPASGAPR